MKTPFGTEVDLGPGHIVIWFDWYPAPPPRNGHSSPAYFRPVSIVATVAHLSYCCALVISTSANWVKQRSLVYHFSKGSALIVLLIAPGLRLLYI